MMISTKGRYSVRILLDLAEHENGSFIPMKEVAARQGISLKYIEKILPSLKNSGLIESVHGTGGGYRLLKSPEKITLWEILISAEGNSLVPVACLQPDAPVCERAAQCKTLGVWKEYYAITKSYFENITLADLAQSETQLDYVI
ncbi:MAG: Rrf2 family transcriptional regulator [Clostridia bacterium]|nr:Rrf2 family transcriptional regulator [Clostridia bacterium]